MFKKILKLIITKAHLFFPGMLFFWGGFYGLLTYKPIDASLPFEAPSYDYAFMFFMIVGGFLLSKIWTSKE